MNWMAAIVLGIGICDSASDYCPGTLGSAALEAGIEKNKHQLFTEYEHKSDIYRKDEGMDTYMIKYRYRIK